MQSYFMDSRIRGNDEWVDSRVHGNDGGRLDSQGAEEPAPYRATASPLHAA
jgi:hypothetical protein